MPPTQLLISTRQSSLTLPPCPPVLTSCALQSLLGSGGIKIDEKMPAHTSSHTATANGMLGLGIADYVHKQTCFKQFLPVNRRLSLEPGHGLPANWWPQPALASLRRHIVFLMAAQGPGQAGLEPGVLPPALSSSRQLFPISLMLLGPR